MSTRVISNNEIKDEDVNELLFNLKPSDEGTSTRITNSKYYLTLVDEREVCTYIDKHSIDNLILALQEAKRLWGEGDE